MALTQEALKQVLHPRPHRFYPSAGSTNDLANTWLKEGAPAGSVVIADEQKEGRGRKGRVWYTPPHVALAVSIILKPPQQFLHRISLLGAVAVAELCQHAGAKGVGIKWPNDVQIHGRKVSGILPEVVWDDETLLGVVLGIGVNVRADFGGTELAHIATSLEPAVGQHLKRTTLIHYLLQRIDYWSQFIGDVLLFNTWKSKLNTLGKAIRLEYNGQVIEGVAIDVDQNGALSIRTANNEVISVLAGDIALTETR